MKRYSFRAKNPNNKIVKDTMMAESVADAALRLEQQGFTILEINEAEREYASPYPHQEYTPEIKSEEFTIQEKKEFFNAFYHLYNSGVSVIETLRLINRSTTDPKIKAFCTLVIKKTERGMLLREALHNNTKQLGVAYTMLIAAGEESGKLEETIAEIIKNINKQEELKSSLVTALAYPAILSFVTLTVAMIFQFFIMKVFKAAAADIDNICIKSLIISALVKMAIVYGILIFAIFYIYNNKELTAKIREYFSRLKLFGNVIKNFYFSNFFHVLALSYDAGVPITDSLIMANSVVNIPSCKVRLKKAAKMVQDGCKLSTAIATADIFTSYAISQVSAGEEAGELGKMFKAVAYDYETKLDTAIQIMRKTIEPTMIVIIGIIVGGMVITGYKSYFDTITSMF